MKKLFLLAASAALVACSENPTQPNPSSLQSPNLTVITPPGVDLLVCQSGTTNASIDILSPPFVAYGGTCTLSADHKKGVLDLSSSDGDGDYASVYSLDSNPYGDFLTNITELSYSYKSLNVPALLPSAGELSYNIPIDTDNDGYTNDFAFVDAAYCGVKSSASVNVVTATNCKIYYAGTPYANWAALLAAPALQNAKIALLDYYIFVIAERTGGGRSAKWEISNVKFGKTGLVCFDGTRDGFGAGGLCTLGKDFKTATLDNLDSDPDGGYAGVYSKETTGYGLFLSNIKDLTLKFSGLNTPLPGELQYYIPISNNGSGTQDFRVTVDMAGCLGTLGGGGVHTVNITRDLACEIIKGATTYPNWAAFAAAYPNARTATDQTSTNYYTNWIVLQATRQGGDPATRFIISDVKWGAKK